MRFMMQLLAPNEDEIKSSHRERTEYKPAPAQHGRSSKAAMSSLSADSWETRADDQRARVCNKFDPAAIRIRAGSDHFISANCKIA
jgi:hypothetical protein